LNISTKTDATEKKILYVTKNNDDLIFLSDTRLNSNVQKAAMHDLQKKLQMRGYKFEANSKTSSRGVMILISNKLDFEVESIISCDTGNYLLIGAKIKGRKVTVGAVYGPNEDDRNFFSNLIRDLKLLGNENIIIGGDWNATIDNGPVEHNLDIINMVNLPSRLRSNWLLNLSEELDLVDPYRIFYPNKRDFTFIPSGLQQINRSRLDFFLMSKSIVPCCLSCNISPTLPSKTFDHKPVFLTFGRKKSASTHIVKDELLSDPMLRYKVGAAVCDVYIHHLAVNDDFRLDCKENLAAITGQTMLNLAEYQQKKMEMLTSQNTELILNEIAEHEHNIIFFGNLLPDPEFFTGKQKTCDDDFFFEALCSCIKNETLSYQSFYYKTRKAAKKNLSNRIVELKKNYVANKNHIQELERNLNDMEEQELVEEAKKYKVFDILNNEKITPYFLKILKGSEKENSLDEIKQDGGLPFDSDSERESFIAGYYENVYRADPTVINCNTEDIEEFLGETSNNTEIRNCKLLEQEKNYLDSDLSIEELDRSIKSANMKSAPGADGLSNKFIKSFWGFFRQPLLDYANCCYRKGTLTDSFRGAKIKLIPKKGDLSKIKNWRPISLLNCFYKIISRTLTNRLRKYMDKLTPTCQKGYSKTRQCQEVLISVVDFVRMCEKDGRKAAVLSLDISKAFDSLSHSFLKSALKYYNFGPNFSRWVEIIATNRFASIVLSANKNSRIFNLERGNAQGDTISPFLFNLCYQILLFKLEFDVQIAGIQPRHPNHDAPPLGVVPGPAAQVPGEEAAAGGGAPEGPAEQVPVDTCTCNHKVHAYADDGNILIKLCIENLNRIKEILSNFGVISGLKCNVEKTALFPVGGGGGFDPSGEKFRFYNC